MRGRGGPVVSERGPRQTSEAEADWRAEVDDDEEAHRGCVWRKMLRDQQHGCSSARTVGMASRLGRWSNTANARRRATTPHQKKVGSEQSTDAALDPNCSLQAAAPALSLACACCTLASFVR
jgi:hypothetical protein